MQIHTNLGNRYPSAPTAPIFSTLLESNRPRTRTRTRIRIHTNHESPVDQCALCKMCSLLILTSLPNFPCCNLGGKRDTLSAPGWLVGWLDLFTTLGTYIIHHTCTLFPYYLGGVKYLYRYYVRTTGGVYVSRRGSG